MRFQSSIPCQTSHSGNFLVKQCVWRNLNFYQTFIRHFNFLSDLSDSLTRLMMDNNIFKDTMFSSKMAHNYVSIVWWQEYCGFFFFQHLWANNKLGRVGQPRHTILILRRNYVLSLSPKCANQFFVIISISCVLWLSSYFRQLF